MRTTTKQCYLLPLSLLPIRKKAQEHIFMESPWCRPGFLDPQSDGPQSLSQDSKQIPSSICRTFRADIKMANSILKSHILRSKNLPDFLWPRHRDSNASLRHRRFPHLRVLLRSLHFHLLPPPLSFPCSFLPLFRRRLPPILSPMSASVNFSQDKDAPAADPAAKTVRVVIKGRVQGVFYRNWTINNANELGLKGWVRNRRDGSVEALFSGIPEKVEEMEQRCRRGPPDAMVTAFQVFLSNDDPGTSFQRKPTV